MKMSSGRICGMWMMVLNGCLTCLCLHRLGSKRWFSIPAFLLYAHMLLFFYVYCSIIKSSSSSSSNLNHSSQKSNKGMIDGSTKELEILQEKYELEEKRWLQVFEDLQEKCFKGKQDLKQMKCIYNEDLETQKKEYEQLKTKYNEDLETQKKDLKKLRAEYNEEFEARKKWKCRYDEDLEVWNKVYRKLSGEIEELQAREQDQKKLRAECNEEFEAQKKELIASYDDELRRREDAYEELIANCKNIHEDCEKLTERCKYDSEMSAKAMSFVFEKANMNNDNNEEKLIELKVELDKLGAEYKNMILEREMWAKEKSKIVADHEEEKIKIVLDHEKAKSKIVEDYEKILVKKKLKYKEDRQEWNHERTNLVSQLCFASRSAELYRVILHEFDQFQCGGRESE